MATNKTVNIDNYRNHNKKINLGTILFAVIFLYILICIILSSKTENIVGYQVKTGMLAENRIYDGIAIRDEHIVTSNYSGYVNYFLTECERAGCGNLVYCIDESGKLSDFYGKSPVEDNSLTNTELRSLRQELQLFSKNFSSDYFAEADSFERQINTELRKIENRRIIDDVNTISKENSNDIIDYCRAVDSGIVLFYKDGYEEYISSDLTLADFDKENYSQSVILNDDLIETGGFVYKYINDENWSVVIKVLNDEVERILNEEYISVKFSETLETSWGQVSLVNRYEDYSLVELKFTNSMITFADDRFVEVELLLEEDTGLKIPNSSIAEKAFFLVDKNYVTKGNNTSESIVLRREYTENGMIAKTVDIDIVKEDEDVYYVDPLSLNYGDVLIKPDSPVTTTDENAFIVGKQGTLIGVYNINKGYAEFNRIEILYSNDEYSIIKPNSAYGLRAYDYIALDAAIVTDKDFVY